MAAGDELSDIIFERNIVLTDRRAGLLGLFGDVWLGNSSFKSNLYFNASAEDGAITDQWPSWQNGTHCVAWR